MTTMWRRNKEQGFTLIELLIVVAILGILAAVIIPNVGRFLGRGEDEARRAEFHDLATAVTALMTENNISSIPVPALDGAGTTTCTTGTSDMTVFPDSTSDDATPATPGKVAQPDGATDYTFPGDKPGFMLFGHDLTADAATTSVVNYINFNNTTHCYTIDGNGTVHQYLVGSDVEVVD